MGIGGKHSLIALAGLSFVVLKGDGCGGPGATSTCSGAEANIVLRPGYCAPIPNCVSGSGTYQAQYSISTLDGLPGWLQLSATKGSMEDFEPTTPADAFRVCAAREPTAMEPSKTSFKVEITKPGESAFVATQQKVNVTVRSTVPTVSINVVENLNNVRISSTDTATGELRGTVLVGGKFRVRLLAVNSDAGSCADLTWTIQPKGAATCDPVLPFEADVDLTGVDPGVDVTISLSVKEPSDGYVSHSNQIVLKPSVDDPNARVFEISGPIQVAAYETVTFTATCLRGTWSRQPCNAAFHSWGWYRDGALVPSNDATLSVMMSPTAVTSSLVEVDAIDDAGHQVAGSLVVSVR